MTTPAQRSLTGKDRRALRARAHALNPVVIIGSAGLSEGVLAEADRALDDHELIKIKVAHEERAARKGLIDQLCSSLNAELIQTIGKIAVVWRPAPEGD